VNQTVLHHRTLKKISIEEGQIKKKLSIETFTNMCNSSKNFQTLKSANNKRASVVKEIGWCDNKKSRNHSTKNEKIKKKLKRRKEEKERIKEKKSTDINAPKRDLTWLNFTIKDLEVIKLICFSSQDLKTERKLKFCSSNKNRV
jgi:hypothetical protein